MTNRYFGSDCPKGKVQVEFVNCRPNEKNGEYGWKPADYASLEIFVDGQRFRIEVGEIPGEGLRGLSIFFPTGSTFKKTAVNVVQVSLAKTEETNDKQRHPDWRVLNPAQGHKHPTEAVRAPES